MSEANESMEEIFQRIGKTFGYTEVQADFVAFRDFKCQWERSYRWIKLRISDYLADAPKGVIEGLAKTLYGKIAGCGNAPGYGEEMGRHVLSDTFTKEKQPIYLKRSKTLTKGSAGECKDLMGSVKRLQEQGLIPKDDLVRYVWNDTPYNSKANSFSSLMRAVMISKALDSDVVPDLVLDYVVYVETMKMNHFRETFGKESKEYEPEKEAGFENRQEATDWLHNVGISV